MSLRLSLIRRFTFLLNANSLDQLVGTERVRGTRLTMLRLRPHSAHTLHKGFTTRRGFGCKAPCAAQVPAAKTAALLLQRSVTAAAGQADSFAVSDVAYSQQIRHLTDIHAWIAVCESHGTQFEGVDNFAAIRKLVEVRPLPGPGQPPVRQWSHQNNILPVPEMICAVSHIQFLCSFFAILMLACLFSSDNASASLRTEFSKPQPIRLEILILPNSKCWFLSCRNLVLCSSMLSGMCAARLSLSHC